jgi:sugar phosphate isomerase/epimerase
MKITRRSVVLMPFALSAQTAQAKMGIATTSFPIVRPPGGTIGFLEHCHALGAGGIQANIGGDIQKLRARAGELGMYIEGMAGLPRADDTSAFERNLINAKEAGAIAIRVAALGGRRYETFNKLDEWKQFVSTSTAALKAAIPLLEKHRIPLALENHKDWTLDELVNLLKSYSSEYLGVCFDFGNNVALLDDPMEMIEQLAPYAISTHVKDMGLEPYEDGFLLSEVPLGDGFLDLQRIVSTIRRARPKTRLTLEMITRDPLKIPCFTEKYWATFPDRSGSYLARMVRTVRQKSSPKPLPRISQMPPSEQARMELDFVKRSMQYAAEKLGG